MGLWYNMETEELEDFDIKKTKLYIWGRRIILTIAGGGLLAVFIKDFFF